MSPAWYRCARVVRSRLDSGIKEDSSKADGIPSRSKEDKLEQSSCQKPAPISGYGRYRARWRPECLNPSGIRSCAGFRLENDVAGRGRGRESLEGPND